MKWRWVTLDPEDELISKLKTEIGRQLPEVFREMAEQMLVRARIEEIK